MKDRSNLTIFDKIKRKQKLTQRAIAAVMILVFVVTTCFASGIVSDKAEAEGEGTKAEPKEYISYVMDEIRNDPTRKFIVLEIVSDESEAEFPYYAPALKDVNMDGSEKDGVLTKVSYMTQYELKWSHMRTAGNENPNVYVKLQQIRAVAAGTDNATYGNGLIDATCSLMSIRTMRNGFSGKYNMEIENSFLQVVVPEYYSELKDRLEVHVIEANDLTVEDIETADLVYVHSGSNQGGAVELNRLFSTIVGPGEGTTESGTGKNRVAPTINKNYKKSGDSFSEESNPGRYLFTDYEYVEYGSPEDERYNSVIEKYTAEDPAHLPFVEYKHYETSDGQGYYQSRDMNWMVARKLMEYCIKGKYFPLEDKIATLPIMINHNGFKGEGSNVDKAITLVETVSSKPFSISDTNEGQVHPYDVIIGDEGKEQWLTTAVEVYAVTGMRTAAFSFLNYDFVREGKLNDYILQQGSNATIGGDNKYYNKDKEIKDGDILDDGKLDVYICNSLNYSYQAWTPNGTVRGFYDSLRQDSRYEFASWQEEDIPKALLNIKNTDYSGFQDGLRDNFMTFNSDSSMVPSSRYDAINGSSTDGFLDRFDDDQQYKYNMIRWILGASGGSSIDPNPGKGATVELSMLEIEPCNDFTYSNRDEVAKLLTDIISKNNTTYAPVAGDETLYEVAGKPKETKYRVYVDTYTVNAFNGLETDIISKYDVIYFGANNSGLGSVYADTSNVYFPQNTTNGVESNDLTDVKYQEISDYLDARNVVLLSNDFSGTNVNASSNVGNLISSAMSGGYVTFRNDASSLAYLIDKTTTPTITASIKGGGNLNPEASDYDSTTGLIKVSESDRFEVEYEVHNCIKGKDYAVLFYIDEDNDGIYGESKSELRSALSITAPSESLVGTMPASTDLTSYEAFNSGFASWKLVVYQADETPEGEVPSVKTQDFITTHFTTGDPENNHNFKAQIAKRGSVTGSLPLVKTGYEEVELKVLQLQGTGSVDLGSLLSSRLSEVRLAVHYNISFDKKPVTTDLSGIDLSVYQMIIMGTGDYADLPDSSKKILQNWAVNDKSVLFMNDTADDVIDADMSAESIGQSSEKVNAKGAGKQISVVSTLNEGQITRYPYDIDEHSTVSTDADMEVNRALLDFLSSGDASDVRVWNTLTNGNTDATGNYFDADYKDAINNYYIYSKGNMVYTAMNDCVTEEEQKLMINMIVHVASRTQWKASPSIQVTNGIMINGSTYVIYTNLSDIKEIGAVNPAEADAMRAEQYVIDFIARNYDNKDMDGEVYWYSDANDNSTKKLLCEYKGSNRLKSGETNTIALVSQADAVAIIAALEDEKLKIEIQATNDDYMTTTKYVLFKERKIYNLH